MWGWVSGLIFHGEWLEVPGGSVMQQSTLEDDRQLGCRGLGG